MRAEPRIHPGLTIVAGTLLLLSLCGCFPSIEDLETVDHAPLAGSGWVVSTPAAEGLDPLLVAAQHCKNVASDWRIRRQLRTSESKL